MSLLLFLLLLSLVAPAWADITSNRVLYLRLNEGSGTSLTDTGGSHTASVANPTWSTGATCKEDDCLTFNGTNTVITVTDATDLSPTTGTNVDTAFSLTFWVFMTSITPTQMLFEKGDTGSCGEIEWQVWVDASTMYFQLYEPGSPVDLIGRSAPLTTGSHQGQWVHVAATYSGTEASTGINIYLNGSPVDNADVNNGAYTGMGNTACDVTLGAQGADTFPLGGRLDEIKYFARELTSSDVTEDLNSLSVSSVVRNRILMY